MTAPYDIIVLGAGPGGYVAAIRAAQLGLKTAIVEDKHLGGVCLNWGCIPTKTLLRSAELYRTFQHSHMYGIKADNVTVDIQAMVQRSRQVSEQLTKGIRHLLKKNKIDVYEGWGMLEDPVHEVHGVTVKQKDKNLSLKANNIILATGAKARVLPGFEPNGKTIWSAAHAMTPSALPKTLLVMGSGAIGVEFASFYNALGVKVVLAEVEGRILNAEDSDIAAAAQKSFQKQGIDILTHTKVSMVRQDETTSTVTLDVKGKVTTQTFDVILPAVGVIGNITGYNLEKTKVCVEKNQIVTHGIGQTHEPGIYAIGDVAAAPWLAHKASHEGILVAEKIAGHTPKPLDKTLIPGCTYSFPQIASVGLTETQAFESHKTIKVGRFSFAGNGKALALGEPEGMIKVIFHEKTGELLGAHMVGADVTELIQGFTLAKTNELTEEEFIHTIFPHPTLSEVMPEAVLDAYGRVIHS